jgi:hypothetical protein
LNNLLEILSLKTKKIEILENSCNKFINNKECDEYFETNQTQTNNSLEILNGNTLQTNNNTTVSSPQINQFKRKKNNSVNIVPVRTLSELHTIKDDVLNNSLIIHSQDNLEKLKEVRLLN